MCADEIKWVMTYRMWCDYSDVIMSAMASQITGVSIVSSTGEDKRKHQSSAPLAFVRVIHRWPMDSPHKGPVTREMFPFDDVSMYLTGASSGIGRSCAVELARWGPKLALTGRNEENLRETVDRCKKQGLSSRRVGLTLKLCDHLRCIRGG